MTDPARPHPLLRALARRLLSGRARARLRRLAADLPHRRRDFFADLGEALRSGPELPLPPARLRHRVGPNSSREEFLRIGEICARDLLAAYRTVPRDPARDRRWLDFGAGCGRVARHLIGQPPIGDYTGADVDRAQIAWARRHLKGRFAVLAPAPPAPFADAAFDVVFTISVFTHLDAPAERAWLEELRRVLRPGGLLLATTHSPEIARATPGPTRDELERLAATGFLFRASPGPFNEQAAFHAESYLARVWGERFVPRGWLPRALGNFQDISLWERPER